MWLPCIGAIPMTWLTWPYSQFPAAWLANFPWVKPNDAASTAPTNHCFTLFPSSLSNNWWQTAGFQVNKCNEEPGLDRCSVKPNPAPYYWEKGPFSMSARCRISCNVQSFSRTPSRKTSTKRSSQVDPFQLSCCICLAHLLHIDIYWCWYGYLASITSISTWHLLHMLHWEGASLPSPKLAILLEHVSYQ